MCKVGQPLPPLNKLEPHTTTKKSNMPLSPPKNVRFDDFVEIEYTEQGVDRSSQIPEASIIRRRLNNYTVTFNTKVAIILIPSKQEYHKKNIAQDIWYSNEELQV